MRSFSPFVLQLRIELQSRVNEVDMFAQMGGNTVLLARNVRSSCSFVFIDVIFRLQELLGFIDRAIELQEAERLALRDASVTDAGGGEPVSDGGDGFLAADSDCKLECR